jgi:hypothetical protein
MSALGHKQTLRRIRRCPLYPRKRTSLRETGASALCQKRTSRLSDISRYTLYMLSAEAIRLWNIERCQSIQSISREPYAAMAAPADSVLKPVIAPKEFSANNKGWRPKDIQFASFGGLIFETALAVFSTG